MKLAILLLTLAACGGSAFELAPQDSQPQCVVEGVMPTGALDLLCDAGQAATPTRPACTVQGVAYPACDSIPHPYGMKFETDAGYIGLCFHESAAARVNCAAGDPCSVFPDDGGTLDGQCR